MQASLLAKQCSCQYGNAILRTRLWSLTNPLVSRGRPQQSATGHRPCMVTGHRLPATHRPPATGHRPWLHGHRPAATGHPIDHRPPAIGHRPPASGHTKKSYPRFGALLEVEIMKLHVVVARSTFRSQHVKAPRAQITFGRSDVASCGRSKGFCTFLKVSKTWGFCSSAKRHVHQRC